MKIITIILFLTLITQSMFSQDIEKCREIVKITTDAINTKSTIELEKHLANDFEIANQKGKMAKVVLKQLFTQLNDSIYSYKEVNSKIIDNSLTISYSIKYKKMGEKDAIFVFNERNELKKIELFKMKVKTMNSSKRVINKPEKEVITIPFKMIGNLIAVEVILNNKKRVFILDSGSPKVILNSKYIQQNDTINKKTISSAKGVSGSISGMDIQKIEKLDFAGIKIENQDILTLDISHLEKALETDIEIYGLIGFELIKDYDVLFDYDKRELILINPEFFTQYKNNELSNCKLSIVPFSLSSHIPVINARIGSKDYSFGIDCGAGINLLDKRHFQKLSKYLKHIEKDTLSGADKNRVEVEKGLLKKVIIGGKRFKNTKTVFSDISHLNNGYKLKLDGLMGYELLSKQKTLISYRRKEMIFIK